MTYNVQKLLLYITVIESFMDILRVMYILRRLCVKILSCELRLSHY